MQRGLVVLILIVRIIADIILTMKYITYNLVMLKGLLLIVNMAIIGCIANVTGNVKFCGLIILSNRRHETDEKRC